jgi:hypothetical protein
MEYKIITSGDTTPEKATEQLSQRITQQLRDGWELVGGVSLAQDSRTVVGHAFFTACQAIRK